MHVIRRSCQQKEEERGRRGSKGGGYWWTFFSFSFSNGIQNAMHGVFASSLLDEMFSVVGGFDWFLFFCRTVPSTKGGRGGPFSMQGGISYTHQEIFVVSSPSRGSLSLSHTRTHNLSRFCLHLTRNCPCGCRKWSRPFPHLGWRARIRDCRSTRRRLKISEDGRFVASIPGPDKLTPWVFSLHPWR